MENTQRDCSEQHLRRSAAALGYKGKHLPMKIADVLVHPQRKGDFTLLCHEGERRRDAIVRLRNWAWGGVVDGQAITDSLSAGKPGGR
jgi:hypothetical protein